MAVTRFSAPEKFWKWLHAAAKEEFKSSHPGEPQVKDIRDYRPCDICGQIHDGHGLGDLDGRQEP